MNPKPKGIPGSYFVGLDIFRRTLTVSATTKYLYKVGFHIDFTIENNTLINKGKTLNFDGDYVILLDGELRIGISHYHLSENAREVLSAGRISIENGKIISLDSWSGHYTPSIEDLADAVAFFNINDLTDASFQAYYITFDQ